MDNDEKRSPEEAPQGERREGAANDEQQGSGNRPYRPDNNGGGDQADNRSQGDGERRPFRPRYDNDRGGQGDGERRPFRPRYNDDRGGQRGGYNQRGPRAGAPGRRPQDKPRWHVAENTPRGPRYRIDNKLFDAEEEATREGRDPEMAQMPETLRLNRFIALGGVCSRREADELIKKGLVSVDGQVVTELGVTIPASAHVECNGKVITPEKKVYVLLNKPKDTVTTTDDPEGRRTVMDIVAGAAPERIYPVGRLDRNTTGVLVLTNDGDLAEKLMHPKYEIRKIYHVFLNRPVDENDLQRIVGGIELDDGPANADEVSYVAGADRSQVGLVIHSGRNRIVRRIFEALGYEVTRLDRVYYAGLTKLNLPRGHWRYLSDEEINKLKSGVFK